MSKPFPWSWLSVSYIKCWEYGFIGESFFFFFLKRKFGGWWRAATVTNRQVRMGSTWSSSNVIGHYWRATLWASLKSCTTRADSTITLTPKVECPKSLNDYRPVSTVGCFYKIISKVLASRLQQVTGELIGGNTLLTGLKI